ncbi:endonuclease SmrB [Pasteurellaceae bacterium TAE3-ERU1]|nr:endonuclease SmrB [Pasteurellaceae bacterium TAE3-ERU1]
MSLDEDDIMLFRSQVRGVKALRQDTHSAPVRKTVKKRERMLEAQKQDNLFYFSDQYEPHLEEGETIRYRRENEQPHLLKQLRRGDFEPELFLDLHGLTREQAKQELAALLLACEQENVACASIMTGYGTYALKQQIPRWLVQHPKVRALHQAPKEWGGDAAFLFLFDVQS